MKLSQPVRSMTAAANGKGYWMVADDGGIFAFNVPFEGSLPRVRELFGYPVRLERAHAVVADQRRLLHPRLERHGVGLREREVLRFAPGFVGS